MRDEVALRSSQIEKEKNHFKLFKQAQATDHVEKKPRSIPVRKPKHSAFTQLQQLEGFRNVKMMLPPECRNLESLKEKIAELTELVNRSKLASEEEKNV